MEEKYKELIVKLNEQFNSITAKAKADKTINSLAYKNYRIRHIRMKINIRNTAKIKQNLTQLHVEEKYLQQKLFTIKKDLK